jgi:hypothetical protein
VRSCMVPFGKTFHPLGGMCMDPFCSRGIAPW